MKESDFRQLCNEDPTDDLIRFAYADWLQERDRDDESNWVRGHVNHYLIGDSGDGGGIGDGGDSGDGGGIGDGGGGGGGDGGGDSGDGGSIGDGGGGGDSGGVFKGKIMFEVSEQLLVLIQSGYNPAAYVGVVRRTFNGGMGIELEGVMCARCPNGDWQGLAEGVDDLRRLASYRPTVGLVRLPQIARAHVWKGELPFKLED